MTDDDEAVAAFLAHGERRFYQAGCKCDECRGADLDYQRSRTPKTPPAVTLESTPPPGPWVTRGRCRTVPTAVFFPDRGEPAEAAKAVCRACPVIDECREYALAAPLALQGVWGGMSAKTRRDIKAGQRWAS